MSEYRITKHPILPVKPTAEVDFYWNGKLLKGRQGEMISSALFANGIRIFGHHHKDGAPQGIFCANGQCAQCMVIADGIPVKSCMTTIRAGMKIESMDTLPILPNVDRVFDVKAIETLEVPVLIIGGGPAGMSAAIQLGQKGIKTLLVDDKHRLGGKLVLQTHRFFGSVEAVYAGTRGIDIATLLGKEVSQYSSVEVWLNSPALAVFSDKQVGVLKDGRLYKLIKPQVLLAACGAREKSLTFNGNTLPGVYGAGAFQTLVNRDLVKPAEKLFIIGGGNVGLIAGYHALQAGIEVVGLVEALPECGGYKVHKDKLVRMGVPVYTSHTILSANGSDQVESITIARLDQNFKPIPHTEISFACDTVLVAVGLDPVNEFTFKAEEYGLPVFSAGDAHEIAEASAAIFSGRITGLEVARFLGFDVGEIPREWYRMGEILKSKPGRKFNELMPDEGGGVTPVIHCTQEIPCNPCSSLCPNNLICVKNVDIRQVPTFLGDNYCCQACERCVVGCPGLAITLVDYRNTPDFPLVSIPYEFNREVIRDQDIVTVLDTEGNPLGDVEVAAVYSIHDSDRTMIVQVQAPKEYARSIAGVRFQDTSVIQPLDQYVEHIHDDMIVCRCERVSAGEIRQLIRSGYRDMNEIKAVTRAGMGACGGKTCTSLILRIFREEGIEFDEIKENVKRPLFIEVPLGKFAGEEGGEE